MKEQFTRTARVMGSESIDILTSKRVIVFGVGGVGGYVVEALARSGVGTLDIVDDDTVAESNLNRQIIALHSTIGENKVDICANRIHDINPSCVVNKHQTFYMPEQADRFDLATYDYVVDAIDTVTAKLDIITRCHSLGVPVISAMGCGNRMDPTKLVFTDIYKTQMDPLAKVMRHELKKRRIPRLKVVYSTEAPIAPLDMEEQSANTPLRSGNPKRSVPGSTAFVPAAAGLIIASRVVQELTDFDPKDRVKGGRQ